MLLFIFLPGESNQEKAQQEGYAADLFSDVVVDDAEVLGVEVRAVESKYFNVQKTGLDAGPEAEIRHDDPCNGQHQPGGLENVRQ